MVRRFTKEKGNTLISRIKGSLIQVTDEAALVEINGVFYDVLVPTALAERLKERGVIGQDIVFDTIYYIEAGDKKSNHYPRIVGFTSPVEREFFSLLTQVPGMGVKKALKSLTLPIRDIATAIENKNPSTLSRMPGVGGRLAEKIIAELHGKTTRFALSKSSEPLAVTKPAVSPEPLEEEAIAVLTQLQYSQHEANEMIQRALKRNPKISKVEDLIDAVFKATQAQPEEVSS